MDYSESESYKSDFGKPVCQPSDDNGGGESATSLYNVTNNVQQTPHMQGQDILPSRPVSVQETQNSLREGAFGNILTGLDRMHIDEENRSNPQEGLLHPMQNHMSNGYLTPQGDSHFSPPPRQNQVVTHSVPNQSPVRITNNEQATEIITDTTHRQHEWLNTRQQAQTQQEIDYTVKTKRLESFQGQWPRGHFIHPDDLAEAGLYYTGPGDRVQCAWCRGGLLNWELGDTPLGEHQKHFPECPFVRQKIASILSEQTLNFTSSQNFATSENDGHFTPQNQTHMNASLRNGQHNVQSNPQLNRVNNANVEYAEEQKSVKMMKEMGYGADIIKRALSRLYSTRTPVTPERLWTTINTIEQEDREPIDTLPAGDVIPNHQ